MGRRQPGYWLGLVLTGLILIMPGDWWPLVEPRLVLVTPASDAVERDTVAADAFTPDAALESGLMLELNDSEMPKMPAGDDPAAVSPTPVPPPSATPSPTATGSPTGTPSPTAERASATPSPTLTPTSLPPAEPPATPVPLLPVVGGVARVPILMYHYIRVAPNPADQVGVGLSVAPEIFAAQMDYLQRAGYQPVTLEHLARAVRGEIGLPPRPIVLTFDDGYADFYAAAWPVLQRHGFASTLFVITGLVDRPGYVTREQVIELDRSGLVEIASHTVWHADLMTSGPDRLRRELVDSRQTLQDWLEHPVTSFAYPAGRYNAAVLLAVQAAGYRAAVTTRWGREHRRAASLEWPRLRVAGPGTANQLAGLLASR